MTDERPIFQKREIKVPEKTGLYFAKTQKGNLELIPSGCFLLDCVVGGGWPLGRMSNVVGDAASGKTLLAIEACANFIQQFPTGKIIYLEAEAAFDEDYAEALGMPVKSVKFIADELEDFTVEAWYEHMVKLIEELKKSKTACLYIVDSLDALSDRAEKDRAIDKGSYGANKPKMIGQLFRRLVKEIEKTRIHLMIISQTRDNIGVTFGEQKTRTGGRAMDFYASQIIWLAQIKKLKKTIKKQERTYGVQVRARCKKNKIGLPFREAEFPILFGYGVDDITAMLAWLESSDVDMSVWEPYKEGRGSIADGIKKLPKVERAPIIEKLKLAVRDLWEEIETRFLPTESKY